MNEDKWIAQITDKNRRSILVLEISLFLFNGFTSLDKSKIYFLAARVLDERCKVKTKSLFGEVFTFVKGTLVTLLMVLALI